MAGKRTRATRKEEGREARRGKLVKRNGKCRKVKRGKEKVRIKKVGDEKGGET